jgi:hypothetical protein
VARSILALPVTLAVPLFRAPRASAATGTAADQLLLALHHARRGAARGYRVYLEDGPAAALGPMSLPGFLI